MGTLNDLRTRRSARKYTDEMIPDEVLERICEAGTYAPTGMGKQSPIIICVTNREVRDKLSAMNAAVMGSTGDPFYGAPVVCVVLAYRKVGTYLYDGSLVMGNLMNAARAEGVASCWIHRAKEVFDSEEGKAMLEGWGSEGDYEGIGNCILGYAATKAPKARPRKEKCVTYVK